MWLKCAHAVAKTMTHFFIDSKEIATWNKIIFQEIIIFEFNLHLKIHVSLS